MVLIKSYLGQIKLVSLKNGIQPRKWSNIREFETSGYCNYFIILYVFMYFHELGFLFHLLWCSALHGLSVPFEILNSLGSHHYPHRISRRLHPPHLNENHKRNGQMLQIH